MKSCLSNLNLPNARRRRVAGSEHREGPESRLARASLRSDLATPLRGRPGVTLVELLVATGMAMFMLVILAQVFAMVIGVASLHRTLGETDQRARFVLRQLRQDLNGFVATAPSPVVPPFSEDEDNLGYFQYEENSTVAEWDASRIDPTGADTDDVLQFTTRLAPQAFAPGFAGRRDDYLNNGVVDDGDREDHDGDPSTPALADGIDNDMDGETDENIDEADEATVFEELGEISYFIRQTNPNAHASLGPVTYNLYRRQLLVDADAPDPTFIDPLDDNSWYSQFDVSARPERPVDPLTEGVLPEVNEVGDLRYRQNRFAHNPIEPVLLSSLSGKFPHRALSFNDADFDGIHEPAETWFGRPLLRETADGGWDTPDRYLADGSFPTVPFTDPDSDPLMPGTQQNPEDTDNNGLIDFYDDPGPTADPRFSEDLLLTNVLSFDVRIWDPGAPIFEDADGDLIGPGHPDYATQNIADAIAFGAYVDLGYGVDTDDAHLTPLFPPDATWEKRPFFWHNGRISRITDSGDTDNLRRVYDTWTDFYASDGEDNDGDDSLNPDETDEEVTMAGAGLGVPNGLDDDMDMEFDEADEIAEAFVVDSMGPILSGVPPYTDPDLDPTVGIGAPLSAIQIKLRVLEPRSQQTREYTLIHRFVQ